jgi:hypothetical protein
MTDQLDFGVNWVKGFSVRRASSFYVSTTTFFLLHCDEWDRVLALPRHKFVTGATLLQLTHLVQIYRSFSITGNYGRRSFSKYGKHFNRNYSAILATLLLSINLNKVVANFEKHIFLSQTDLTKTGIISNCYNEMFEA